MSLLATIVACEPLVRLVIRSAIFLDMSEFSTFETLGFSAGIPFKAFSSYLHRCATSSVGYSGGGNEVVADFVCC